MRRCTRALFPSALICTVAFSSMLLHNFVLPPPPGRSLTAVAVDRFKAIHHPLESNKRIGKRQVRTREKSTLCGVVGKIFVPLLAVELG